ncbi:Six-bladed beta-propeller, TolB-like protein [Akanthomyces lecanii RCEF 1005]|uniref:Six-bladed beta-propeller, TolB-like protein n=1 Tax=Akanthomyces lecanii RCEF 1005 TaxID=1081108 RepID=A0A168GVC4_CORDF|nr:Six-bladed beta-propeller, TolB-like protein [Akanthomyces lecanii RCEF 1005]
MVSSQFTNATFLPFASLAALFSATAVEASGGNTSQSLGTLRLPAQAQAIDSAQFASIPSVAPPSEYNGTTVWVPPGTTRQGLKDRPFLVFDPEFLEIIGHEPKLAVIAESEKDPLFHEAVVWIPATDEVFFAQNAGAPDAGTGLNKSAIIQKVSVAEALQVASGNKTGHVKVETVTSNPPVVNPNGGTNYKGNILFAGEGMGNKTASALYSVNPRPPYNATILVNNFYGRQFNSLNDIGINPRNSHIYFTDPLYGYLQAFRPPPALPVQVYQLNPDTMAVAVAADGFDQANGKSILYFFIYNLSHVLTLLGITFSPDGKSVYVTDTGANHGFFGYDAARPATIYRFDVAHDGTFQNRMTFAFADNGVPDGIHCDSKGNVYAGCGDGIHVWNPWGKLLGKIFTDGPAANFQFVGDGRLVICAETRLYLALVAAKAAPIH